MGVVVFILYKYTFNIVDGSFISRAIKLMFIIGIGAFVYGVLIYLFRVKEIETVIGMLKKRVLKG